METDIWSLVVFGAISLMAAILAVTVSGRLMPVPAAIRRRLAAPAYSDITLRYAFREGYLLSNVDPNDAFLDAEIDRARAYDALSHSLADLHPDVPSRLAALSARGEAFVMSFDFGPDAMTLSGCKEADETLVLTVAPSEMVKGREAVDSAVLEALNSEAEELRTAIDRSPMLVWKQDEDGSIRWANANYFALLERVDSNQDMMSWPVPRLFDLTPEQIDAATLPQRLQLDLPQEDAPLHFEVTAQPQADRSTVFSALPADGLVAAETALQSFVQTLSKTFASLPVGLAVFDRKRELVMFNPALTSLSTLDIQFLSNRPSLVAFLDALRDHQRMPEPKNYRDWRDKIAQLEEDAVNGSYHDLWTLPGGQSFRVSGRPHPDGAIAFMFEDITAELSLTRKFRGELDLYQTVLETLPGALAVFSQDGQLVFSTPGYAALWGRDESTANNLGEALRTWKECTRPSSLWAEVKGVVLRETSEQSCAGAFELEGGRRMTCVARSLAGGATLVRFEPASEDGTDLGATLLAQVLGEPAGDPNRNYDMAEPAAEFTFSSGRQRAAGGSGL